MIIEQEIIERLSGAGYQIFIVGGAIRDEILGFEPHDIDFATNAKPDEIIPLFNDKHIGIVGKSFKVVFVEGVQIATFRKDTQKVFFSSKYCEPEYADTIQDDLARRDLTINAMAKNAVTGEFFDLYSGVEDLKGGIIRLVGDPIERLRQDPNRIVRACRILAKTEGYFAKETYAALCECAIFIKRHVEAERLCEEILKAMEVKTPSLFFSALHTIGALKYIFPAMDDCFSHIGGQFHKETVGEHLMMTGDIISPKFPILRLAGYLHDIGKPKAYEKEGDGSFKAHEAYGVNFARGYLKKLKFPNNITKEILGLIDAHMRICRGLTPKGTRRLRVYLADSDVDPRSFLRLKIADRSANMYRSPSEIAPIKDLIVGAGIRSVEQPVLSLKDLAMSGGDLITEFNIQPGPVVGRIHRALLEFIVEEGEEFNTYEQLKNKAEELLK